LTAFDESAGDRPSLNAPPIFVALPHLVVEEPIHGSLGERGDW
jgi:hypothetical protein